MIQDKLDNKKLYYRLIALWAVCEAFGGGIMHAAKIPFTGMIVSSLAVTCIILIAYFVPVRGSIIKATIIVAIFKLLLSPHSPPTAYLAVFFQGYIAELLFFNRKFLRIAAIALGIIALVESSIQRILVLIILYGNSFWNAIDQYLAKLFGGYENNYTLILAVAYITIHGVVGYMISVFAVKLAVGTGNFKNAHPEYLLTNELNTENLPARKRKKINTNYIFLFTWFVLLILYIHSLLAPEEAILPSGKVVMILIRSILIILTWFLLISPLVMFFIKKVLHRQKQKYSLTAEAVMILIPETKKMLIKSWSLSSKEKKLKRLQLFCKIIVMNTLSEKHF